MSEKTFADALGRLGWRFARGHVNSISVTGPGGIGCVVDKVANVARMIPEEVLFALAADIQREHAALRAAMDMDTTINGLAHELWAMAQGRTAIEDVVTPMMAELTAFAEAVRTETQVEQVTSAKEAPSRARWKPPRDDYSRSYLQCLADTAPKQKACSHFEAGVGGWCKHNYGGENDACTWRVVPT